MPLVMRVLLVPLVFRRRTGHKKVSKCARRMGEVPLGNKIAAWCARREQSGHKKVSKCARRRGKVPPGVPGAGGEDAGVFFG